MSGRVSLKWLLILMAAVLVLTALVWVQAPDARVHVSFLDVGQGDAILIQQGSTQVLIDGGPSPQAIALELGRRLPFWDRTIELVVLTHPHDDHLTGLLEVLKHYRVGQVLYPLMEGISDDEYNPDLYAEWLRLISNKNIKPTYAQAYQELSLGQMVIDVLNPPQKPLIGTESDVDNASVVLDVRVGKVSFLLAGDLMSEGENELLMSRLVPACTVLKVAHHGSASSTTAEFLSTVDPQIAVISAGADNDYGLPSQEVVDRLAARLGTENIYRTDEHGTVEFITDGERLWVK